MEDNLKINPNSEARNKLKVRISKNQTEAGGRKWKVKSWWITAWGTDLFEMVNCLEWCLNCFENCLKLLELAPIVSETARKLRQLGRICFNFRGLFFISLLFISSNDFEALLLCRKLYLAPSGLDWKFHFRPRAAPWANICCPFRAKWQIFLLNKSSSFTFTVTKTQYTRS